MENTATKRGFVLDFLVIASACGGTVIERSDSKAFIEWASDHAIAIDLTSGEWQLRCVPGWRRTED